MAIHLLHIAKTQKYIWKNLLGMNVKWSENDGMSVSPDQCCFLLELYNFC